MKCTLDIRCHFCKAMNFCVTYDAEKVEGFKCQSCGKNNYIILQFLVVPDVKETMMLKQPETRVC